MRYEPLYNYPIILAIKDRDEAETTNFVSYCVYPVPLAAAVIDRNILTEARSSCVLSRADIERILESAEADNIWSPLHDLLEKLGDAASVRIMVARINNGVRPVAGAA